MKLLFVYYHQYPHFWRDGLWRALKELEKEWDITYVNLVNQTTMDIDFDFALGWGAWDSQADRFLKDYPIKKGLCFAGSVLSGDFDTYDVFFYENPWQNPTHRHAVQAFGVNTDIFYPTDAPKFIDVLGVGALASWKRWESMLDESGVRLVIGEFQKDNKLESGMIADSLIRGGVGYMDMISPEVLSSFYNASRMVYMPSNDYGGGGRVVLEARACGVPVKIAVDNRLLGSYLTSPVWGYKYYVGQLKKGIESCLK